MLWHKAVYASTSPLMTLCLECQVSLKVSLLYGCPCSTTIATVEIVWIACLSFTPGVDTLPDLTVRHNKQQVGPANLTWYAYQHSFTQLSPVALKHSNSCRTLCIPEHAQTTLYLCLCSVQHKKVKKHQVKRVLTFCNNVITIAP